MKITTMTATLAKKFGYETAIKIIADAGFDGVDLSMFSLPPDHPFNGENYREFAAHLNKTAKECGVRFTQAHAPFPSYKHGNDEYNSQIFDKLVRSMEIASIAGARNIVIHPLKEIDNLIDANIAFYNSFIPYCKQFGIKIAVENMFYTIHDTRAIAPSTCSTPDEFVKLMDSLDSNYFTACLDIGHTNLTGAGSSPAEMIRALGHDRLKCMHLHDNDGITDLHTIPYLHKLDWDTAMRTLKEIDYDGEFTYEADQFLKNFPADFMPTAVKFMYDLAKFMVVKYGF